MITYTVKEAYAIHEAMANIIYRKSFKGKIGLVFAYNFRLLHEALSEYITKRDEIITKYADEIDEETKKEYDEKGIIPSPAISNPENLEKANKEIDEFSSVKIELPLMGIKIDDLEKAEDIDSTDMSILLYFCDEMRKDIDKVKNH